MLPGIYHEGGKPFIAFNRRCGYLFFGEPHVCHVTPSGVDFMSVIGFPLDHSLTAQGPILGKRTQKRGLRGGGEAHCGECFYGFVHYLWFDIVRCIMGRGDPQDGG